MKNFPWKSLQKALRKLGFRPADEKGQSLIIMVFAFLGMVAMLGLALDLGLVYVERVRLKRTVDAAVLAAVSELPIEEEAARRAISFLAENGYDVNQANIYVAGCVQDTGDMYDGLVPGSNSVRDELINPPALTALTTAAPLITDTLPIRTDLFYPYIINSPDGNVPTFFIDTRSFQARDSEEAAVCDRGARVGDTNPATRANQFGSASKIRVHGQIPVQMSFMQFFGWSQVTVSDEAVAQNAATLDISVVLDTTSSMAFDTVCYDCWLRCDNAKVQLVYPPGDSLHCTAADIYRDYPDNGRAFPIDYSGLTMQDLIFGNGGNPAAGPLGQPGNPRPESGGDFIIMEAELYTNNTSDWSPYTRSPEQGYWALQRTFGSGAYAVDGYGYTSSNANNSLSGMVRHHPYIEREGEYIWVGHKYIQTEAAAGVAPRLDYKFIPTWSETTYIYFRAQGFTKNDAMYGTRPPERRFFWDVDNINNPKEVDATNLPLSGAWQTSNTWGWVKLDAGALTAGDEHTLYLWAGSTGFAIDRIIITRQNLTLNTNPGSGWDKPRLDSGSAQSALATRLATDGSASRGLASDPCNPIYGQVATPGNCRVMEVYQTVNNLRDPLFQDRQPIRGAMEAVKSFVTRLKPDLDQAGFVTFVSSSQQHSQLECLRAAGERASASSQHNGYPALIPGVEYDETACYDEAEAASGTEPIRFQGVVASVEKMVTSSQYLLGGTNIADGMRRGLHLLGVNTQGATSQNGTHSNDCRTWSWSSGSNTWFLDGRAHPQTDFTSHCARGQASTPVMILLTDGSPTAVSDTDGCQGWGANPNSVKPYETFPMADDRYECIMYYADQAASKGVIIYPIGLGPAVDRDLLNAIADRTNGKAYFVANATQLNSIFDQILGNVYIRLIQ